MNSHYPNFYHFIDNLHIKNIENLNKNIGIIYRNYQKKPSENEICNFKNFCTKNKRKFLVSNYTDLVNKYNLDGFYIPSFNKKKIYIGNKNSQKFILIGSAHNIKEIRIKESQGVQQIILSPIFKSKNSNRPLGLYRYNHLSTQTKLPTIALGGINQDKIKLLRMIKTKGFASINYFKSLNSKS